VIFSVIPEEYDDSSGRRPDFKDVQTVLFYLVAGQYFTTSDRQGQTASDGISFFDAGRKAEKICRELLPEARFIFAREM
jgi:hypothetical protein